MRHHQNGAYLLPHRLMWLFLTSTALFGCIQQCTADEGEWTYHGDKGPSNWVDTYPKCGGKRQSPINIELAKAEHKDLGNLTLSGYDTTDGHQYKLTNNGHTAQLNVESGPEMTVSGGGLPGTYKLAQFHFHWGKTDSVGSEHYVDGKKYPLEIHFVHTNKKYADDFLDHADGAAVLGVFAQVGSEANAALDKVLAKFDDVKNKGPEVAVGSFALRGILPSNIKDFVRYEGSLTTPACNEAVIWTVFADDPITITSEQLAKFRSLKSNAQGGTDEMLADNFRPVQALNDRTVFLTYTVSSAQTINSGHLRLSIVVSLAAIIWALATRN